jgi:signal transduction histidine kinase
VNENRLDDSTPLVPDAAADAAAPDLLARLAKEQAALRRVATLVAEHPASRELFSAVTREVAGVMDVRGVIIDRFEADGSQVTLASAYELELEGADAFLGEGVRLPLHPGTTAAGVWHTHRTARVDYSKLEGQMGDVARAAGLGSGIGAPIIVDGRLWGQMCVYSSQGAALPADTEQRLQDFVDLVATAISNYEARAELRTLADEHAALRRVATLVAEGVELDDVLAAVVEETAAALEGTSSIMRFEGDPPELVFLATSREIEGIPTGSRVLLDDAVAAARLHRSGRPARAGAAELSSQRGPFADALRRLKVASSVASPILLDGELWGCISVSCPDEFPADTEERLSHFANLITTAIANAEAKMELAASRARIAAAADAERRRVVRDLHDGAQQRLVHTVITLKLARAALAAGAENGPLLVERALGSAEQATTELRELAHGIMPTVLTHGGLSAGIEALASRTAVPVRIEVIVDRLPAPVEATAYFFVAEALTNMVKHSAAQRAEVVARIDDVTLYVEVRDDGVGGARPNGSGLVGLADRLAVLDGWLEVDSPAGRGTVLRAAIPLPSPAARPD